MLGACSPLARRGRGGWWDAPMNTHAGNFGTVAARRASSLFAACSAEYTGAGAGAGAGAVAGDGASVGAGAGAPAFVGVVVDVTPTFFLFFFFFFLVQ